MSTIWRSFREGFVGSFALAGAIIMAVVGVASAFVHGDAPAKRHTQRAATRI